MDDTDARDKKFSFAPKSLEISQLKVMKGEEEIETEAMLIQSLANLQLGALKKKFKEDFKVDLYDGVTKKLGNDENFKPEASYWERFTSTNA